MSVEDVWLEGSNAVHRFAADESRLDPKSLPGESPGWPILVAVAEPFPSGRLQARTLLLRAAPIHLAPRCQRAHCETRGSQTNATLAAVLCGGQLGGFVPARGVSSLFQELFQCTGYTERVPDVESEGGRVLLVGPDLETLTVSAPVRPQLRWVSDSQNDPLQP